MLLNCGVGEDLRVPWTARRSVLSVHWKDWCWIWNSNTLATWCEELTPWKIPCFWEKLRAGGKGDDRGWDGWMASLTQWTWVWVNSGIWWWTGKSGVLWFLWSQRVGHEWVTELNWTWRYLHWYRNFTNVWYHCMGFVTHRNKKKFTTKWNSVSIS